MKKKYIYFPIIAQNKKYLSKQAMLITYTVEKRFFAAAIASRFFLDKIKKHLVYFGLCESSLHF